MKRSVLVSLLIVVLLFTAFGGQAARAADPPPDPYLYFSQEELTNLRALRTAPSHQAIWNNIKSWADAHISDPPLVEPAGQSWKTWFDTAAEIRRYLETMAFMYAMTDDTAYAAAARSWMLSVSGWSAWGTGANYSIAQCSSRIILGCSFGYDTLGDYLTSSQRNTIRGAITTHTNLIYNIGQWWENYPNHTAAEVGAIGIAALALRNDMDTSNWLAYAISGTQFFLGCGGKDGSYFEGLSYAPYAMDGLMPFLDALKRVTEQDLFVGNEFLANHAYYYIYLTYNGKPLQFEDCNWSEGYSSVSLPFIYKLASEYDNGYAQWFANNYASQSMMQSFIWKNPDVVAVSPVSLPLTGHFDDTGYVVTRSGWGSNDLVFAFKSGSSRGHAHNSQNEFGIYYQGKPITCGPGYVCVCLTDDTWSHNSILVGGLGQCQEPGDYGSCPLGTRGQILAVEVRETNYVYMLGDASAVYTGWSGTSAGRTYTVGKLDLWHRHIVFVQNPNYFVIFDRLEAPSSKRFDYVLNLPQLSWGGSVPQISISEDLITLNQQGVQLKAVIVEPGGFGYEVVPYDQVDWDIGNWKANQVRVSTPTAAPTAEFLTVLYPDAVLPVEEVKAGNLLGVISTHNSNKDLVLFSTDGNPVDQYVELGGYYRAIDGGSYTFDDTKVRAQFDKYQVMRLEQLTGTNHAPALDPIGNKAVYEGQLLEFIVTATDPDGDNLTYSASNLPEGASFDPAAQTFSWTPTYVQAGTYPNVHFGVTDGNLTDVEDITITVKYPPGDANGDGSVDSLDITKVKRIIMGLDDPTPGADANGDGNVNALDITKIELIIMGAW